MYIYYTVHVLDGRSVAFFPLFCFQTHHCSDAPVPNPPCIPVTLAKLKTMSPFEVGHSIYLYCCIIHSRRIYSVVALLLSNIFLWLKKCAQSHDCVSISENLLLLAAACGLLASWPGNETASGTASWPGNETASGIASWPGNETASGTASWPGNETACGLFSWPGNETACGIASWPGNETASGTASCPGNELLNMFSLLPSAFLS